MSSENSNATPSRRDQEDFKSKCALLRYPKGVFFCLGNEFSERFSFYGMTALLTLYLYNVHHMTEAKASLTFHAFSFVCYFSPLLGSVVADGFLGRYRVILYVSIFYCCGHVLITLGAVESLLDASARYIFDIVGLFVVAVSTGGIKPCVVSFAADQFPERQAEDRKHFFSFFYFAVNSGALLATFLTPIFRTELSYAVAFGVPAVFMGLALAIFVCGRPFYKIEHKKGQNIVWQFAKCVAHGLVKTIGHRGPPEKGTHWLDHSVPAYGRCFVEDIKTVLSITVLYVPLIFFWALFVQQGSTWVLQANRMTGRIGRFTIIPEQIGVINPLLIIALIPLFEQFIYPVLNAKRLLTKPLQRISFGGILTALSFFVAGFIQLKINKTIVVLADKGEVKYTFTNMADQYVNFTGNYSSFYLEPGQTMTKNLKPLNGSLEFQNGKQILIARCNTPSSVKGEFVAFWDSNLTTTLPLTRTSYDLEKTPNSNAKLYVLFHPFFDVAPYHSVRLIAAQLDRPEHAINYAYGNESERFFEIKQASVWSGHVFNISLEICVDNSTCSDKHLITYETLPGEARGLAISDRGSVQLVDLVPPNTVHILWQVPQYILITVGEIFFSISGLEFSYSQAAPSMKSLVQALWLMNSAFGHVVDIAVTGSGSIEDKALEFFVYACFMVLVICVFVFLSHRYKYVDRSNTLELANTVEGSHHSN